MAAQNKYTINAILELMDNYVPSSKIEKFLSKYLLPEMLPDFYNFIQTVANSKLSSYLKNIKSKCIIFLFYQEVIPYDQLARWYGYKIEDILNYVSIELGLYSKPNGGWPFKKYFRDYIISVYYGDKEKDCYKNLNEVETIFHEIENSDNWKDYTRFLRPNTDTDIGIFRTRSEKEINQMNVVINNVINNGNPLLHYNPPPLGKTITITASEPIFESKEKNTTLTCSDEIVLKEDAELKICVYSAYDRSNEKVNFKKEFNEEIWKKISIRTINYKLFE